MDHVMAECHMDLHGFSPTVSMDRCHSENLGCDAVKQRRHAVCCVSSRRKVDNLWHSWCSIQFLWNLVGQRRAGNILAVLEGLSCSGGCNGAFTLPKSRRCLAPFAAVSNAPSRDNRFCNVFSFYHIFIIILSFFGPYILYCSRLITSFNILQC